MDTITMETRSLAADEHLLAASLRRLAVLAEQAAAEVARYRRLHTDIDHAAGVLGEQHPAARLVEQVTAGLSDPLAVVMFDAFTAEGTTGTPSAQPAPLSST